jgi:uncharacterized protein YoxC
MKDLISSWLLGIAFGAIAVGLYYDGFVAGEYKKKLNEAGRALERAAKEIQIRDQDIQILIQYMEQIRNQNKRLQKDV